MTGVQTCALPISGALGRRAHRCDLGAEHWFRSVRAPARFTDAIAAMIGDGYRAFVEIAPHPSLCAGIVEVADQLGVQAVAVPSLHRGVDDARSMAQAAGIAWTHGLAPRLDRVVPDGPRARVAIVRAADRAGDPPPRVVVRSLPGAARVAWLTRYICDRLASLMSRTADAAAPPPAEVLLDHPLNTLGLDSLSAQAFRRHLELQLELAVPLSALLGGLTGRGLAGLLAGALPQVTSDGDELEDGTIEDGTIDA